MKLLYQLELELVKKVLNLFIMFVIYAEQEPNKLKNLKLILMKKKEKHQRIWSTVS